MLGDDGLSRLALVFEKMHVVVVDQVVGELHLAEQLGRRVLGNGALSLGSRVERTNMLIGHVGAVPLARPPFPALDRGQPLVSKTEGAEHVEGRIFATRDGGTAERKDGASKPMRSGVVGVPFPPKNQR